MRFFYESKGRSVRVEYGESLEYAAHLHAHIELVYMLKGHSKVVVDSKEYEFSAGDLLLIFPYQVHQYIKIAPEHYILAIFPPEVCPEYREYFSRTPKTAVLYQADPSGTWLMLLNQLIKTASQSAALQNSIIKGYLLILLGQMFQKMQFREGENRNPELLRCALSYCMEHFREEITLDQLAREMHVNKYYLSHLFSDRLQMGFKHYVETLRVSEACMLLSSGQKNITEVAELSGFPSIRTFNRVFAKQTGMTPSEYRKQTIELK